MLGINSRQEQADVRHSYTTSILKVRFRRSIGIGLALGVFALRMFGGLPENQGTLGEDRFSEVVLCLNSEPDRDFRDFQSEDSSLHRLLRDLGVESIEYLFSNTGTIEILGSQKPAPGFRRYYVIEFQGYADLKQVIQDLSSHKDVERAEFLYTKDEGGVSLPLSFPSFKPGVLTIKLSIDPASGFGLNRTGIDQLDSLLSKYHALSMKSTHKPLKVAQDAVGLEAERRQKLNQQFRALGRHRIFVVEFPLSVDLPEAASALEGIAEVEYVQLHYHGSFD